MLETVYQSTKTFPTGYSYWPDTIYLASIDAVLHAVYVPNHGAFRKVFLDGTYFDIQSKGSFSGYFLSAVEGKGAATMSVSGVINIAMLDEISCLPMLSEPLNGVDFTGKAGAGSLVDHIRGLVYTPGARVLVDGRYCQEVKVYSLATGVLQNTLNVPFSASADWTAGSARLHAAGNSLILLTADSNRVAIFDGIQGNVTFTGLLPSGRQGSAYDTTHNVIISLMTSGRVVVSALNNVGYSLAAPSFSPAPALYKLSRVTTRLISSDGQGVAGKTVLWYLAGGKGYLEHHYSLTDDNGYARNWYYGPDSTAGLGQETVNIEVVV